MNYAFSAAELCALAAFGDSDTVFGVPLQSLTEEEWMTVLNTLILKNVIIEGEDGNLSFDESIRGLVQAISMCEKCLIASVSRESVSDKTIWWYRQGEYWSAKIHDMQYEITGPDTAFNTPAWSNLIYTAPCETPDLTVTVPQIALARAGRCLDKGEAEHALRILRQNGVPVELASVIMDGLRDHAVLIELECIDGRRVGTVSESFCVLNSRGINLSMKDQVQDLRSCIVFSTISTEDVQTVFRAFSQGFCEN